MKKKGLENHVSNTKQPSGDYYGTGIRNPVGKLRDTYITDVMKPKKASKPKSLA